MKKSTNPTPAVASAKSDLPQPTPRRSGGKSEEQLGLTDDPLPHGGEPISVPTVNRLRRRRSSKTAKGVTTCKTRAVTPPQFPGGNPPDALTPSNIDPSDPSATDPEIAQHSDGSEGIEGTEETEGRLLAQVTHARACDEGGGEVRTPLDPFDPFAKPAEPTRIQVSLTDGYSPHDLAAQLWDTLVRTNEKAPRLYVSGGTPVRMETIDGAVRLVDLTRYSLASEVHRVATFVTMKGDAPYEVPAPSDLIHEMLSFPALNIPLPRLCRIASAPSIDDDGVIVVGPGYHPRIQTFLEFRHQLPTIPTAPTSDDLQKARDLILQPLADFPFVSHGSRAVAIAAMLLPFLRRKIDGPTPLHLIEKATPGTGATLLTDVLLTPALGPHIATMGAPASEPEWFYSLAAVLRALPRAVVIDNARELKSKELAKALTDRYFVTRIVGTSTVATVLVECVWIANGNSVTLHQEIARRVLRCQLDAGMEQPWLNRQFRIANLRQWLIDHRVELIWACLTIIRSWFAAGCPEGTRSLGMFESYSALMGGVLEHLGVEDFLSSETLADPMEDLQSEAESWFVAGWWTAHRNQPVTVTDLLPIATADGSIVLEYWGALPPQGNLPKLGHFLRSIRNKTFNVSATGTSPAAIVVVRRLSNDSVTRRARYELRLRGGQ